MSVMNNEGERLELISYAERFILNRDTLSALSKLENRQQEDENYQCVNIDLDGIKKFGFKGTSISSCAREVNKIFVALEIPYCARIGKGILKIFRYSDKWEAKMYACAEAKMEGRFYNGRKLVYEEPTIETRKRVVKWLEENKDFTIDMRRLWSI